MSGGCIEERMQHLEKLNAWTGHTTSRLVSLREADVTQLLKPQSGSLQVFRVHLQADQVRPHHQKGLDVDADTKCTKQHRHHILVQSAATTAINVS